MIEKKKKLQMPDTYLIIFFVVVFAWFLTMLIPVGVFTGTKVTEGGKEILDPQTFTNKFIENEEGQLVPDRNGKTFKKVVPVFKEFGGMGLLNYVFEGLVSGSKWNSAVGVIAFILIVGGAFGIVLRTGAVEAGLMSIISKTKGREVIIIPILFVLFSAGGAVFGMGEEAVAFAMILVPIMVTLGYDAITGVLVIYGGTQIGFATSWMNPFSVMVAQGISGTVGHGFVFRIIMWLFFTALGIVFTLFYASKIKKNPRLSTSYESDAYFRENFKDNDSPKSEFNLGHMLVLLTVLGGVVWIIWGVVSYGIGKGWYLPSIATAFFIMGLISGIIGAIFKLNGMTFNDIGVSFRQGASDLVGAALVVGMAKGIILVLGGDNANTPNVLNSILHGTGVILENVPGFISAWFMYIFQSVFNFFVVSGSGQAAITMPIMAPLAKLLNLSPDLSVLAFQLGDGFTNMIVPTSGALLGTLGAARVKWSDWARFQIKFQGVLFAAASIFVIIGFFVL